MKGARLQLHRPTPRDVSLVRNKPWEGNVSGYTTVFQDGGLYRMYYRGTDTVYTPGKVTSPHREVVCYAESKDGVHWTRPELGLVEFEGSKKNNIIWDGVGSHNFTPFLDTVLEAFGPDRLMIGSNWPVCTLAADYGRALGVVVDWSEKLSEDERAAILGRTCARFYSVQ